MKVFILGHDGNMGQRYKAILRHYGHDIAGFDKKSGGIGTFDFEGADRIIIATPTATHIQDLKAAIPYKVPILCEKPFSKNRQDLNEILTIAESHQTKVSMVNQYEWMPFTRERDGETVYNYFKHGGDGLYWDCINIIYHANGEVELGENSPKWSCRINGDPLSIADMDFAYLRMIDHWTQSPTCGAAHIWKAHEKVRKLEALCKQS
jgi:hypothetical protein